MRTTTRRHPLYVLRKSSTEISSNLTRAPLTYSLILLWTYDSAEPSSTLHEPAWKTEADFAECGEIGLVHTTAY
jgi:hypothetical protein